MQHFTLAVARERLTAEGPSAPIVPNGPVHEVLDLARWTPSGDNAQPWRFEVLGDKAFAVHGRPAGDIYDLQGHASQVAWGALLETIVIAAEFRRGRMVGLPLPPALVGIALTALAAVIESGIVDHHGERALFHLAPRTACERVRPELQGILRALSFSG